MENGLFASESACRAPRGLPLSLIVVPDVPAAMWAGRTRGPGTGVVDVDPPAWVPDLTHPDVDAGRGGRLPVPDERDRLA